MESKRIPFARCVQAAGVERPQAPLFLGLLWLASFALLLWGDLPGNDPLFKRKIDEHRPLIMLCLPFGHVWAMESPNFNTHRHTLEKVAPWSVISGSFAVCISPLNLDTAGNNV